MYKIKYNNCIDADLDLLPDPILKEALKYFKLLEQDYEKYSLPLYNMYGRDLIGYRKTYFWDAEYRIISKLEDGIVKIINVIAVGKRENMEVYKIAHQRINKH